MKNEYLFSLNFAKFLQLISNAQKSIIYSYPSLHPEIVDALIRAVNPGVDVKIIIDPSENNFRSGYGSIDAVEELKRNDVPIYEYPNNFVSFLIVDDTGWYIFPQSRIFEEDGKSLNAVAISRLEQIKLQNYFFPPANLFEEQQALELGKEANRQFQEEIKEIISNVEESRKNPPVKKLNTEKLEQTKQKLELNPPLEPDLRRKIDVYTAKIQYVELNFSGAKFEAKKIPIPIEALPIRDERLIRILETKIRMFENLKSDSALWELDMLYKNADKLRKKLSKSIKGKNKRVLRIDNKKQFLEEFNNIKEEVRNFRKDAKSLFEYEINKAKHALSDTLTDYFKNTKNPSINSPEKVNRFIEYIISGINFPSPQDFTNEIKIDCNFYDFTWEDLKKEELLKELRKSKIIDNEDYEEIVQIKKAYSTKV